jgi:hypothetical protein
VYASRPSLPPARATLASRRLATPYLGWTCTNRSRQPPGAFPNSEATVVDAKNVKYHDREVGFNEWGTSVTGWPSINIYDWAVNEKGETLSKLRDAYIRDKQV